MKEQKIEEITKPRDIAILAGLNSPRLSDADNADEETMAELEALVETAGGQTAATVLQNRAAPDPRTFIGEGKVAELKELVKNETATTVIFDNDLSPSQLRVLTGELGVQVLDRSALILDIFAQRARTREGRLQVELAQYQYLLPRLTGMWTHLERQAGTSGKGPIGSKGPGETQLETDRRHIHRKIDKLREDLEDVRRVRNTQRRQRRKNEIPVAALVGYTNAGKSTLLNQLTGAGIPANNRLFDTLDTTSRLLHVSDTTDVVLSDTVGFIRKLPHQLVEAFKATLEELEYADLLLHVIDVSSEDWQGQARVVEDLILELGAGELPRIDVFNKSDLLPPGEIMPHGEDICAISARTGEGVEQSWTEAVSWYRKAADLGLPRGQCNLAWCHEHGKGVEKSQAEAFRWYMAAAKQGYPRGLFNVARDYDYGLSQPQDQAEACRWYQRAADAGYAPAMCDLGVCYERGEGVEQSWEKAVELYRKAADLGNAPGQCNLGYLYEVGRGVEQSWTEAVRWYKAAAEQGFPRAMCNLAWCYENGKGVERNLARALELYRAAADQGFQEAQEALERLKDAKPEKREKGGFFKGFFGGGRGK